MKTFQGLKFAIVALTLSTPAMATVRLHVPQKGTLRYLKSQKSVEFEANQDLSISGDEPLLVESEGHLPMTLVPIHSSSDVEINTPSVKEAIGDASQEEVSRLLSESLVEVTEIQELIQRKRFDEAMERIRAVEAKYPKVKFFEFIRASLLLLTGHRDEARRVAEDAHKAIPNYAAGKKFLDNLGGNAQ